MKTRVVKTSKGYVPQVWMKTKETAGFLWWREPIYAWYGIDQFGFTNKDTRTQLLQCLAVTEKEALNWIEKYKEYKDRDNVEVNDVITLSSI